MICGLIITRRGSTALVPFQEGDDPPADGEPIGVAAKSGDGFYSPTFPEQRAQMFFHESVLIGKTAYQHLAGGIGPVVEVDGHELLSGMVNDRGI